MKRITITANELDAVEIELLRKLGKPADAGGASLEIEFEGGVTPMELGQMLGAAAGAWLNGARGPDGQAAATTAEDRAALVVCIMTAFGVAADKGIKVSDTREEAESHGPN